MGVSIFACDEYVVYSNVSMEVVPGVVTSAILGSLKVKLGGKFGTAMNTNVFLKVWAKLFSERRFSLHDWTVKVDPDAVFLPERLRSILANYEEVSEGVYLNNCKFGLHGPVEVFSKNA